MTLRETLESVQRQTGKVPEQLQDIPEFPEEVSYLWDWWCEISGGEYLTYTEINNWNTLSGYRIKPWEVRALIRIDRTYRGKLNE